MAQSGHCMSASTTGFIFLKLARPGASCAAQATQYKQDSKVLLSQYDRWLAGTLQSPMPSPMLERTPYHIGALAPVALTAADWLLDARASFRSER